METSKKTQILSILAALTFALGAMAAAYRAIGLPPVVIVGGSSMIGLVIWMRTYLKNPVDPRIILPPFLLTVAALQIHMGEELFTGFAPAFSRVFDVSWSEHSFILVFMVVGPALYTLTALGLFYRVPLAGFIAWFIFIGPGCAEFTHFIFPLLRPAFQADVLAPISQAVSNGNFIADMKNYWLGATGTYYFPGMYTAVLPMIPGTWAMVRTFRAHRRAQTAQPSAQALVPSAVSV